jgi:signal transduction histidine kinase
MRDDITAIAGIDAVPRMLEVICRTTGLGFAAVARVTADRWIACAVRDEISFGLAPGGELPVTTTICDAIRDSGRQVVIDHVEHDPIYRNHPTPKLYGFQSYISVPIRRRDGRFFGTLCAIDRKPAKLNTSETIGLFALFAELIGFHLEAGDRLIELERGIADRTAALTESHARLAQVLQERTGWLSTVISAQEDERRRVARELHDEMSQHLTALTMGLQRFADVAPHQDAVVRLTDLITRMDQSVHRLARDLRPAELDDLGLVPALTSYVAEWSQRTGIHADMTGPHCACRWPPHVESALYRIAQEALTNVARHAQAHRASVVVDRRPDAVAVVIEDDGAGFDTGGVARTDRDRFGLVGMRERAVLLGGTLTVESTPAGTSVFVTVPCGTIAHAPPVAGNDHSVTSDESSSVEGSYTRNAPN